MKVFTDHFDSLPIKEQMQIVYSELCDVLDSLSSNQTNDDYPSLATLLY